MVGHLTKKMGNHLCTRHTHTQILSEEFGLGPHLGHSEFLSSLDCSSMYQSCDHRWSYLDSHRPDGSHNHKNQEGTLEIRKEAIICFVYKLRH